MPSQFSTKAAGNTNESLTACRLDCNTLSYLERELQLPYEHIYGTFLFFKCGDYKITSQFMDMRDPQGGWRGRQHALERIHAVSAKMNNMMFKAWIALRKEWLETCRGITGGTMEDTLLFAMDLLFADGPEPRRWGVHPKSPIGDPLGFHRDTPSSTSRRADA